MGTSRRARRRGERGASAVEFALIVPLLMMILFGLITTGLAFSDHLSATNATREGARYGAATSISSSSWATSVRDRVKQTYFNAGVTVTNDQICVRLVRSTGTTAAEQIGASCGSAPPLPANMASGSCAVLVWMQRPQRIRLIAFPDLTFNSRAESVAYYSRKVASTCPVA